MTVYANSDYYVREYLAGKAATISTAIFPYYARKASSYINQYTFDNIGDVIPDCVRLCCCELAEALFMIDNSPSSVGVTSERVGDVSVSYESAEMKKQNLPHTIRGIIYSWLGDTGLLYRGGNHVDE